MTGFSASEVTKEKYRISWELKSVNNRFKDFRFRMPSFLSSQEIHIRKKIEKKFSRGSFEVSCQVKKNNNSRANSNIDYEKVKSFISEFEENMNLNNLKFSPLSFLRSEFQKDENEDEKSELINDALSCLDELLDKLLIAREQEGQKLKEVFISYLKVCRDQILDIEKLSKTYKDEIEKKLKIKFDEKTKDLDQSLDQERFSKELIYYLEKLDIDEEVKRAYIHIQKLNDLLTNKDDKPIGREIEFTLQELNRETNTIGSKSGHEMISSLVVDTKVVLEKMREQALNIE